LVKEFYFLVSSSPRNRQYQENIWDENYKKPSMQRQEGEKITEGRLWNNFINTLLKI